ncbi:hypothetical protein V1517DRAFT_136665 [Lipomyces orientalis]|uniref:Uncharacterized protein n=1 Tax=Lipomyces orientalis TaxID=1233043 RepID=A0ACC3TMH2_9ASCO
MKVRAHTRKRTRSPSERSPSRYSSPEPRVTVSIQRQRHRGTGIDASSLLIGARKDAKYETSVATAALITADKNCGQAMKFMHPDSLDVVEKFASEYIEAEMKKRNTSDSCVKSESSVRAISRTARSTTVDNQVQSATLGKLFEVQPSHEKIESKSTSAYEKPERRRSEPHVKGAYRGLSERLQTVLKETMSTSYLTPTFDRGKRLSAEQIEEQLIADEAGIPKQSGRQSGHPTQAKARSRKR